MAISKIISSSISDNTVVAADVGPNAITASELADDAVDTAAIANDAVTGAKIENNPTIAGNLTVSGTSTLTGNATASGNLTVTGTSTLTGALNTTNIKHASSGSNNLVLSSDGTTTVSNISYPRYVIVKSSDDISGANNRSLSYSTSWTDHMYTGNFTTQKKGDIEAYFSAGHGYEQEAVRLQVLWELRNSSGTDVSATYWKTSSGSAPSITSYGGETHGRVQNCFKQGFGSNMSFGCNSNHIIFPSVPAGTYNLYVRVSNNNTTSTAIMNNFLSEADILTVYHY